MAKIKYRAVDANGFTHTRTSPRVYTHTIVARSNYAYDLARAQEADKVEGYRANFKYEQRIIRTKGTGGYTQPSWQSDESWAKQNADRLASAHRAVRGFTDVADYLADLRERCIADVERKKAEGHYDAYVNIGWCGRPDLAQKLFAQSRNKEWYTDVCILEAKAN